ncbi:MAG TPA: hypothetical protein VGA04_00990 [Streptosporangiaceae bacterium]
MLTSPPDAVGAVAVAGVLATVLAAAGSLARGRGLAAAAPGAEAVAEQAETRAAAHIAAATAVKPRSAGRGGCGSRSVQRVAGRSWRRARVTAGGLVAAACLVAAAAWSFRAAWSR